jgi:hypothetical protein
MQMDERFNENPMTILSRIVSRLPVAPAVAWKYLVHLSDCDKWMEERDLIGIALLLENGAYAGFQVGPVDVGMEPIVCLVHKMATKQSRENAL